MIRENILSMALTGLKDAARSRQMTSLRENAFLPTIAGIHVLIAVKDANPHRLTTTKAALSRTSSVSGRSWACGILRETAMIPANARKMSTLSHAKKGNAGLPVRMMVIAAGDFDAMQRAAAVCERMCAGMGW